MNKNIFRYIGFILMVVACLAQIFGLISSGMRTGTLEVAVAIIMAGEILQGRTREKKYQKLILILAILALLVDGFFHFIRV